MHSLIPLIERFLFLPASSAFDPYLDSESALLRNPSLLELYCSSSENYFLSMDPVFVWMDDRVLSPILKPPDCLSGAIVLLPSFPSLILFYLWA